MKRVQCVHAQALRPTISYTYIDSIWLYIYIYKTKQCDKKFLICCIYTASDIRYSLQSLSKPFQDKGKPDLLKSNIFHNTHEKSVESEIEVKIFIRFRNSYVTIIDHHYLLCLYCLDEDQNLCALSVIFTIIIITYM